MFMGAIDELAGRPSSGLTQEQADQRYLKLSGGTMEDMRRNHRKEFGY